MAGQKIATQSQNMIECLEFFMTHPGFSYNQTYKPLYIYNENEHQVSNKMHIGK